METRFTGNNRYLFIDCMAIAYLLIVVGGAEVYCGPAGPSGDLRCPDQDTGKRGNEGHGHRNRYVRCLNQSDF